ncbi:MAG: transposase [Clostridium sp.]|nr:transposase [Clostridium sp.]
MFKEDFVRHNRSRKRDHDYCFPCKYHITITKAVETSDFGRLPERIDLANPDSIDICRNALGNLIAKTVRELPLFEPRIEIYQYKVMPDHLHFLIAVKQRLDRHLGKLIGQLKSIVTVDWRRMTGNDRSEVFSDGYNDRIIFADSPLDPVFRYRYIRQNPYRLAVRRLRPDFFRKTRRIFVGDREIQAYGNLFNLRNPFKFPLIVHRDDNEQIFRQKPEDSLYYASGGESIHRGRSVSR